MVMSIELKHISKDDDVKISPGLCRNNNLLCSNQFVMHVEKILDNLKVMALGTVGLSRAVGT